MSNNYKPLNGTNSAVEKIVHWSLWAAKAHPGVFFQVQDATKAAFNLPRRPTMHSNEVKQFLSARQRIKAVLFADHKKSLVSNRDLGVRATTDDLDFTKHCITKSATRASHATFRLKEEIKAVNVSSFPATAEGKVWKEFVTDKRDLIKEIESVNADFIQKLLPPASV